MWMSGAEGDGRLAGSLVEWREQWLDVDKRVYGWIAKQTTMTMNPEKYEWIQYEYEA